MRICLRRAPLASHFSLQPRQAECGVRRRRIADTSARWLLEDAGKPSPYSRNDTIRPGLRVMNAPWGEWLLLASPAMEEARTLKLSLLRDNAMRAKCSASDGRQTTRTAELEVLEMIMHASQSQPQILEVGPLEAAASLVGEDLILLRQEADEPAVVCSAFVCFSFGQLDCKLGKPLNAIHKPVPGYSKSLAKPLDRIFRQLSVDRGYWRHNMEFRWSGDLLHPSLTSGCPEAKGQLEDLSLSPQFRAKERAPEHLYLRVEYQTLRRLPATQHILFTVATHTDPLAELVRSSPRVAAALLARVESFSQSMCEYKGIAPGVRNGLVSYLKEAARL